MSASVVVLKFGSSVLRTDLDLPIAVGEIDREVRHQQRVIAVVSAYHGVTDQRFAQALRLGNDPHDQAAYVAQGEEESSTQLVRALIAHGVPARYLEPTAIDLCAEGDPHDSTPIAVERERLARALADHSVLVVPGYIAHDRAGRCVLLGRGGSDLTALFLAERMAARCRLLKDVDGVRVAMIAVSLEPRYSFERSAIGPWLSVIAASCARMPWMPVKLAVRCTRRSMR